VESFLTQLETYLSELSEETFQTMIRSVVALKTTKDQYLSQETGDFLSSFVGHLFLTLSSVNRSYLGEYSPREKYFSLS
jgi:hypothetical protein